MWRLVALAAFATACGTGGSKGDSTCDNYVERTLSCGGDDTAAMSSDDKSQYRSNQRNLCRTAFAEKSESTNGDLYLETLAAVRTKATCVVEAKNCAAAKSCETY